MAYFNISSDDLPEPDEDSRQHSEQVLMAVKGLIEAGGGFIGFDRYMEVALYAPGLGYYSAGREKFGRSGDFVTAPLISPMFSHTLARFIGDRLSKGEAILELGAGTGTMAADMLSYLSDNGTEPPNYLILEPSAELQQRQKARLGELSVSWIDHLNTHKNFSGVIVGNEVMDAMPVKRFAIQSGEILELGVGLCRGNLCWKTSSVDDDFKQMVLSRLPSTVEKYPDGYCSEFRPAVDGWVRMLADYMRAGTVILFDYGHDRSSYYAIARHTGTLRSYYQHYMLEDPFAFPGVSDLTASVDFTEIAESALCHGFEVAGYTSQANFLIDNGLLDLMQTERSTAALQTEIGYLSTAEAVKCLTDPGEMGESVKVLVLSKHRDIDSGFTRDQRYRL